MTEELDTIASLGMSESGARHKAVCPPTDNQLRKVVKAADAIVALLDRVLKAATTDEAILMLVDPIPPLIEAYRDARKASGAP